MIIEDRILRLPETERMSGLSRAEIYRREALGTFPNRIPLGERTTGWLLSEVLVWIKERAAQRAEATAARSAKGHELAAGRAKRKRELQPA